MPLEELSPQEVARRLEAGDIILIDVREPQEFGMERIQGSLLHPLSTFDPLALPVGGPRSVVLHCAAGKRSAMAAQLAQEAGLEVNAHLSGGLAAWKQAGLSVLKIDPATGQMRRS